MDKILEKLFTKYFIFKVQTEWKEELKKIPEELLKKWMDDELFVKIQAECENLASDVISDIDRKWDNELWMDINDFVNEYQTDLELAEEAEAEKEEDYWDTDDEDPADDFGEDDPDQYNFPVVKDLSGEVKLMYCTDADVTCDCDHAEPHPYSAGCTCGCVYTQHYRCEPYIEKEAEDQEDQEDTRFKPPVPGYRNEPVPDEIVETGGL